MQERQQKLTAAIAGNILSNLVIECIILIHITSVLHFRAILFEDGEPLLLAVGHHFLRNRVGTENDAV